MDKASDVKKKKKNKPYTLLYVTSSQPTFYGPTMQAVTRRPVTSKEKIQVLGDFCTFFKNL
jgi:hypothetical protein